ncbi:hypothetical protein EJ07DRAFT_159228 [Lizonia empirigonia]|nr:hypothetical protein EJ07DRAFT_159228 [Lizonia empirigonia]
MDTALGIQHLQRPRCLLGSMELLSQTNTMQATNFDHTMRDTNFAPPTSNIGNSIETCWRLTRTTPHAYPTAPLLAFVSVLECTSTPSPPSQTLSSFIQACLFFNRAFYESTIRAFEFFYKLEMLPHRGFAQRFGHAATHRRFFVTAGGRWGLGPDAMREGDVCAVLGGADVPFVLRRVGGDEGGRGEFRLVGQVYVYGVMYLNTFHTASPKSVLYKTRLPEASTTPKPNPNLSNPLTKKTIHLPVILSSWFLTHVNSNNNDNNDDNDNNNDNNNDNGGGSSSDQGGGYLRGGGEQITTPHPPPHNPTQHNPAPRSSTHGCASQRGREIQTSSHCTPTLTLAHRTVPEGTTNANASPRLAGQCRAINSTPAQQANGTPYPPNQHALQSKARKVRQNHTRTKYSKSSIRYPNPDDHMGETLTRLPPAISQWHARLTRVRYRGVRKQKHATGVYTR